MCKHGCRNRVRYLGQGLHLGPEADYIAKTFWFVLQTNTFKLNLHYIDKQDEYECALQCLKSEMWQHYRAEQQENEDFAKRGSKAPARVGLYMCQHATDLSHRCANDTPHWGPSGPTQGRLTGAIMHEAHRHHMWCHMAVCMGCPACHETHPTSKKQGCWKRLHMCAPACNVTNLNWTVECGPQTFKLWSNGWR